MSNSSFSCSIHRDDDYTQCLRRFASRNDMDGFGSRADSCHDRASSAITTTITTTTTTTTATTRRGRISFKSHRRHGKAGNRISVKGNILLPVLLLKMMMIGRMIMIMSILSEHVRATEGFTLSARVDFNVGGGCWGHGRVGDSANIIQRVELAGHVYKRRRRRTMILEMIEMESNDNAQDNDNNGDDDDWNMMGGDHGGGVVLNDLTWRVEKLRLEEQNKRRFLKSGARFLPYEECRKWVQAWGKSYWQTRDDWYSWIAMGEKRNAYIPSRPDEYYTKSGDWISWEHFLITPPETSSSALSLLTACNTTENEPSSSDEEEIQRQKPK